jgi:hypothetical protein
VKARAQLPALGPAGVPEGARGPWRIDSFAISEEEARFENMRALMRPGGGLMRVTAGSYKRLVHERRGVVMSNTPMEVRTNIEALIAAEGRVLVLGLGLGMLLEALLRKPAVSFVRVVEIDPDVIALVGPHFAGDPRVEIVQGDALEYQPIPGERWNLVWADIWDTIGGDNLADMAKLGRRWNKRRADRFLAWCREILIAERERDRRSGSWW